MAASYKPREVTESVSCGDFGLFQDILKRLRTIDDRVINALNTSLPTESFRGKVSAEQQCKDFYEELHLAHTQRETIIKKCINEVSTVVSDLRHKRDSGTDDIELIKQLRKEQKTLRHMQQELNIEEVIRDRSSKAYYDRCRLIYLPSSFRPS